MKKSGIIYLIGLISLCFGCGDFLEEKSQSEVIPKTAADFGELLIGSAYWGTGRIMSFLYLLDDDVQLNLADPLSIEPCFAAFTWQPDMADRVQTAEGLSGTANVYANLYGKIKGCNAVLDNIDRAIGKQAEKDKVKAEALTLRSWFYMFLVNLYGEPYNVNKKADGVPLQLTCDVDEAPRKRNTVEEVYNQMIGDLTEAIELFKKAGITRTTNYHLNLASAYLIRSRLYLYMEEWQKCIDDADAAIALGGEVRDMTGITALTPTAVYSSGECEWLYGYREYTFYACSDNLRFCPSDELMELFDRSRDSRCNAWFCTKKRTDYSTSPAITITGTIIQKHDSNERLGNALRIVEAYLNRAESLARLGKNAADDINHIRRRRIVGYTDVLTVSLDEVLLERRKELCFESTRWFDLRRCGMPEIKHVWQADQTAPAMSYTLQKNDPMYTLPLPGVVLERNSGLVQNISRKTELREGVMK